MFHVHNGLYFERVDDETESVRIVKRASAADDAPIIFEQVIDRHAWVSIVGEVSHNPELTHAMAWAVHTGIDGGV